MNELIELKKDILNAAMNAGEGHIPSAFSILDIVWVLYNKVMTKNDVFILSKGHGSLALYAVLAEKGYFPKSELLNFCKPNGILGGHPDRNKVPGVEASTGSLGHGLPIAVGRALAKKINKESGRIFCLIGDGEANEGSIWEACLLASHHNLTNLVLIVDFNHSTDRAIHLDREDGLEIKFNAFGFYSYPIDGHDSEQLITLRRKGFHPIHPLAVVANTVKGNGIERFKLPEWHHRVPTKDEYAEILKELECENS